jgi:uncharacterized membrane protein YbhN (UPF0104 family)
VLLIILPFVDLPTWVVRGGVVFGSAAILGTVVLVVLSRFGERGVDWVWRLVGSIPLVGHPKVRRAVASLLEGFGVLTNGKLLPKIALASFLVWLGYAAFNYILMAAFRMTYLPLASAGLVLCATGFAMVVPSSPGAMGVFEWAAVQALSVYGVGDTTAFGYAFGLHMFTNISLIIFGLIGLAREGLSYSQIRSQAGNEPSRSVADTSTP